MNSKNILRGVAALGLAASVAGTAIAADIQPAKYDQGVVTALNAAAGTITVGGATYQLRRAGDVDNDVTTGRQVDVTYLTEGNNKVAIAVAPLNDQRDRNNNFVE